MKKTIYVTGIAGLLGNNIVSELGNQYKVTGADKCKNSIKTDYDVFDLIDELRLYDSINRRKPDAIIHTAALVDVDLCERDKELAYKLNTEMTRTLVDIAKEKSIKLIYISTDAVFDGKKKGLYVEEDNVNPLNEYAKSKLLGEQYVQQIKNSLILRTNIYGINVQKKKSFGEWVADSLYQNQTIHMFEDIFFSPILVNELARIIEQCLERNLTGLYHACGTGAISKYNFGIYLKKVFNINTGEIIKSSSDSMSFIAPRSKNMGMSNEKLCRELNIKIRTPEESIIEFYRLYEKKYGMNREVTI